MSSNLPVVPVAEAFGRNHYDVLRDICNLVISQEFNARNFAETPCVHPQNGETYSMYRLTRNGFMILAMGYNGAKAMALKEAYIAEFNRMEAELANRVTMKIKTPHAIAQGPCPFWGASELIHSLAS